MDQIITGIRGAWTAVREALLHVAEFAVDTPIVIAIAVGVAITAAGLVHIISDHLRNR